MKKKTVEKKTNAKVNKGNLIEGAVIGAVMGVVAGILMDPAVGKDARRTMKKRSAEFYSYIAPQIKKLKKVGEAEYHALVAEGVKRYAKVKKLSLAEEKSLVAEAKRPWKHITKHLR